MLPSLNHGDRLRVTGAPISARPMIWARDQSSILARRWRGPMMFRKSSMTERDGFSELAWMAIQWPIAAPGGSSCGSQCPLRRRQVRWPTAGGRRGRGATGKLASSMTSVEKLRASEGWPSRRARTDEAGRHGPSGRQQGQLLWCTSQAWMVSAPSTRRRQQSRPRGPWRARCEWERRAAIRPGLPARGRCIEESKGAGSENRRRLVRSKAAFQQQLPSALTDPGRSWSSEEQGPMR